MQNNYEEQMAIIRGKNNQNAQQLTPEQQKRISEMYMEIYSGLVMNNWTNEGAQMGQSMYNGMEHVKSYIKTKPDNSATEYLRQVQAKHNVTASKQMMDEKYRNMVLDASPELRQDYKKRATTQVNKNMAELNEMITRFQKHENDRRKENPIKGPEKISQPRVAPQNAKPAEPTRRAYVQDTPEQREIMQTVRDRNYADARQKVMMLMAQWKAKMRA